MLLYIEFNDDMYYVDKQLFDAAYKVAMLELHAKGIDTDEEGWLDE